MIWFWIIASLVVVWIGVVVAILLLFRQVKRRDEELRKAFRERAHDSSHGVNPHRDDGSCKRRLGKNGARGSHHPNDRKSPSARRSDGTVRRTGHKNGIRYDSHSRRK